MATGARPTEPSRTDHETICSYWFPRNRSPPPSQRSRRFQSSPAISPFCAAPLQGLLLSAGSQPPESGEGLGTAFSMNDFQCLYTLQRSAKPTVGAPPESSFVNPQNFYHNRLFAS